MAFWKARTFDTESEAAYWFEENGFYEVREGRWEDDRGRWAVVKWEDGYKGLIGSEENDLDDIENPS